MTPGKYQDWTGLDKADGQSSPNSRDPLQHTTGIGSDSDNIEYDDTKLSTQNEPYAKKYAIEKMSDNLMEMEDEDYKKGEIVEENSDAEISVLFKDARDKLEKIDVHAKQQKKQIVVELAKSLEGKIPTDAICMKITNQLLGRVSERFIRECLDEKYKQKPRVENARKQKKHNYLEDKEDDLDKLAAVTPLKQEPEKYKITSVEANGQVLVQMDEDNNDKPFSDRIDDDSNEEYAEPSSPKFSYQKEHNRQLARKDHSGQYECPSCNELYARNLELEEAFGKQNQFISADTIENPTNTNNVNTANNIVDFEFCEPLGELCNYLESLLQLGDSDSVWFSGKIDTSTGKVISSEYGSIRQHQQEALTTGVNDD